MKHELSAGGDAEAVLCQSYLLNLLLLPQLQQYLRSEQLSLAQLIGAHRLKHEANVFHCHINNSNEQHRCKVCTVAWASLSVRVERTVSDVTLWCDCHPVLK